MNTINNELVYRIHILHEALIDTQKTLSLLDAQNKCLRQAFGIFDNESYTKCIEDHTNVHPTGTPI